MTDTPTTTTTMTFKKLVLPRLQNSMAIVDGSGVPSNSHVTTLNNSFSQINDAITAIQAQQAALATTVAAVQALEQSNADTLAQLLTLSGLIQDADGKITSLVIANSYTVPATVLTASSSATTSTITIAAHERKYGDGTTVAVDGGTITGLAASTTYYVFYSDPNRTGGAVVYQDSTTSTDAAQTGGIHSVGSVTTPALGATTSSPGVSGGAPGVPSGGGGGRAQEV